MKEDPDTRRRSQRYTLNDTVFLTFRPQFDRMGRLKDISKNGVGFEYVAIDSSTYSGDSTKIEVDIFSGSKDFNLSRVPCEVVYDVKISASSGTGLFENRRCGLQFSDLSTYQVAQLGHLLNTCAAEPVPYL